MPKTSTEIEEILTGHISKLYHSNHPANQELRADLILARGIIQEQRQAVSHMQDEVTKKLRDAADLIEHFYGHTTK